MNSTKTFHGLTDREYDIYTGLCAQMESYARASGSTGRQARAYGDAMRSAPRQLPARVWGGPRS